MNPYISTIFIYFALLVFLNLWRMGKVKTQDEMMVAGRSLPMGVIVLTLICAWIGSGSIIAGAEFASKAGLSSLWMSAGAWVGIGVVYFLAARIRIFGKYTVGDILEVRYGPIGRLFGALALVISYVTIVSYQFVAGGFILEIITDGKISQEKGIILSALLVIIVTASAGMNAVAKSDVINGTIILLACLIAFPAILKNAGGWGQVTQSLPQGFFQIVNPAYGKNPTIKVLGYFLSTLLLLLGEQSMYQKFYSAKTPKSAKQAAFFWILGTIFVETVIVLTAVVAYSVLQKGLGAEEGGKLILLAGKKIAPLLPGVLLLAAACAIVLSTAMNFLLSPSTTLMRDVFQRFLNPKAKEKTMVWGQKLCIILLGGIAYLLATQLKSVLAQAFFAYTVYGVAITPALLAALISKRVTPAGGIWSIFLGTLTAVALKIFISLRPDLCPEGDPWGIPLIFPALLVSFLVLVVVSLISKPPTEEQLTPIFGGEDKKT